MAKLPDTIEVSVREVPEVRAALAVFLDLLGQVDAFIEQEGEADFYTAPARAMRDLLAGKQPAEHLQRGLDKFLAERGIPGVPGTADLRALAHELDGVLDDLKRGKSFDETCRRTVQRVRDELASGVKTCRAGDPTGAKGNCSCDWGGADWRCERASGVLEGCHQVQRQKGTDDV